MAVTYCTADDVALFGMLRASNQQKVVWGTNPPFPDQTMVEDLIEAAERDVEDATRQAWGTRTITVTEESQDIHWAWRYRERYAYLHLKRQNIAAFNSGQGDKLEVFEDGAWVDYLTTYTEGRDEDFFVDYAIGKIYFYNHRPPVGQHLARITYRSNSGSTVPSGIRRATALMVAITLANNPGIQILFPAGEGTIPSLIENYQTQIDKALAPHILVEQPMNTKFIPIW